MQIKVIVVVAGNQNLELQNNQENHPAFKYNNYPFF